MDSVTAASSNPFAQFTGNKTEEVAEPDALGRDTFLQLLTTQLQNQDPTNPASNEEFLAQLAQFTGVEQMMAMNESLEEVYLGIASMNNASMANLLDAEVAAYGDQVGLEEDHQGATLHFEVPKDTAATITVTDETGRVVFSADTMLQEGEDSYAWDGRGISGETVPAGVYTVKVSAEDTEVVPMVVGTVDSMDYTTGAPRPSVDGATFEVGDILRIERSR